MIIRESEYYKNISKTNIPAIYHDMDRLDIIVSNMVKRIQGVLDVIDWNRVFELYDVKEQTDYFTNVEYIEAFARFDSDITDKMEIYPFYTYTTNDITYRFIYLNSKINGPIVKNGYTLIQSQVFTAIDDSFRNIATVFIGHEFSSDDEEQSRKNLIHLIGSIIDMNIEKELRMYGVIFSRMPKEEKNIIVIPDRCSANEVMLEVSIIKSKMFLLNYILSDDIGFDYMYDIGVFNPTMLTYSELVELYGNSQDISYLMNTSFDNYDTAIKAYKRILKEE